MLSARVMAVSRTPSCPYEDNSLGGNTDKETTAKLIHRGPGARLWINSGCQTGLKEGQRGLELRAMSIK